MLRHRRDAITVSLAPGQVRLHRHRRGAPALDVTRGTSGTDAVPEAALWEAGLQALRQIVADAAWQEAETTVVLSGHYTRFIVLPYRDELVSEAERLAYARIGFSEVHGDLGPEWTLRLALTRPGSPLVACAIPARLQESLVLLAREARWRIVSIQPLAVCAHNLWRKNLDRGQHWLVVREPGRTAVVRIRDGQWQFAHTTRATEVAMPDLLDRMAYLTGMPRDDGGTQLCSFEAERDARRVMEARQIIGPMFLDFGRPLPQPGALSYTLAMLGLAVVIVAGLGHQSVAATSTGATARLAQLQPADPGPAGRAPGRRGTGAAMGLTPAQVRTMQTRLAFPWTPFFEVIESSGRRHGGQVALLDVEPEIEARRVRLSGEARNFESLLSYLATLSADPFFSQVYLSSHHLDPDGRPGPVAFTLVAEWGSQP